MLGAIIPRSDRTWFFKVTGPNEILADTQRSFREFLQSVRFEGGEPTWQLPQDWQQRPGSGMRFATLVMASPGPPLELSVTALGTPPGDPTAYVLSNVNRWRDQLQLRPLTASQLADETDSIVLDEASGLAATLVELQGNLSAGGGPMTGRPAAGRAGPVGRPPKPRIEFAQPENWTEGELVSTRGGIRIERAAAFQVSQDDQQLDITVTSLGAAGANRLANVNRWRRELGLPAIAAEDLKLEALDFSGSSADYVELIGGSEAILGVIATHDDLAWFVKLKGDHELALQERERFKQFVASIRIKN